MQYLGEFLSPTNNISQGQDQLTKYFYFRPDKYDNPDADLENIFIIKAMPQFPKRLDRLSENNAYAVDSIQVSKKVEDDSSSIKEVSYVVTATYDLWENIDKRDAQVDENESNTEINNSYDVDEDGNQVNSTTPPWKMKATWNFQPIEVVLPFTKAYNYTSGAERWSGRDIDVVNGARDVLLSETQRYQLEITYTKNYETAQSWEVITKPYLNSDYLELNFDYRGAFAPLTLKILPPSYSMNWYETKKADGTSEFKQYFTYTIKMIYDPECHIKRLLNVGTRAIFAGEQTASQIWEVSTTDVNGMPEGNKKYCSTEAAAVEQANALKAGKTCVATPVSEPLPLTNAGGIDSAVLSGNGKIGILDFVEYAGMPFSTLPWRQ